MKKRRNLLIAVSSCIGALEILFIVLFIMQIMQLWLFLLLTALSAIGICVCIVFIFKIAKKMKLSKLNRVSANKSTGNYMLDVYNLLGLAPQYNKDGTLKNIYEILQISPIYDEKGNRVYTVYEMLGITPMLDENGNEIPQIFAIKNRVGRIAKVGLSTQFLTRKLTPEEEEQKLIRETLEKQLKEAEHAGNNKKAEAIKKVIKDTKKKPAPPKKKSSGESAVKSAKTSLVKKEKIKAGSSPKVVQLSGLAKDVSKIGATLAGAKVTSKVTQPAPGKSTTKQPEKNVIKESEKDNSKEKFEFVKFGNSSGGKQQNSKKGKSSGFQYFDTPMKDENQPGLE